MRIREDELINIFRKEITQREELGLTDDAGLIKIGKKKLVVSQDALYGPTHIPPKMSMFQAGRKAVVISISDIASMGAKPVGVSLAASIAGLSEKEIRDFSRGINSALKEFGVKLLKGDTKNFGELYISTTAFGICKGKVLTRSGAKPGDLLCLTGEVADTACGLEILLNGKKGDKSLVKRALTPIARVKEGLILQEYARACMDISDGLFWTLFEVSRASKVGFRVSSSRIPFTDACREFISKYNLDLKSILSVGEDFELLFTIPKSKLQGLSKKMRFFVMGETFRGEGVYFDGKAITPEGYSTF